MLFNLFSYKVQLRKPLKFRASKLMSAATTWYGLCPKHIHDKTFLSNYPFEIVVHASGLHKELKIQSLTQVVTR